jgi:tetratricopeptide (TPR) repeat protein
MAAFSFLVTLLPTANVVFSGLTTLFAERYLYVPSLFLALGIADVVRRQRRVRAAALGVAALATGALAGATIRAGQFVDPWAFWAHERKVSFGSPAVHQHIARLLLERGDARGAFQELVIANDSAASAFPYDPNRLDVVVEATLLFARLTPDLDARRLTHVDSAIEALADARSKLVVAELGALHFRVAPGEPHLAPRLAVARPRLLGARALIASRLGRDDRALELSAAAVKTCGGCPPALFDRARVEAGAGRYAEALHTLDRAKSASGESDVRDTIARAAEQASRASSPNIAISTNARAMALSTLGLYGRAFAVLAPFDAEFRDNPNVALGFAELACRAGAPDRARPLAERHLAAADAARLMSECRKDHLQSGRTHTASTQRD